MNKTEMQSRLEQTESKTKDVKQDVNTLTELLAKSSPLLLVPTAYMSLRAQFNYLGIPVNGTLGVENYLREAYSLFLDLLFQLFCG